MQEYNGRVSAHEANANGLERAGQPDTATPSYLALLSSNARASVLFSRLLVNDEPLNIVSALNILNKVPETYILHRK